MSATPDSTSADLQRQLAECRAERDEALARETATAEILRVIASSPTDVQPTFEAIAEAAKTLTGAVIGGVCTYDGRLIDLVAASGWTSEEMERTRAVFPIPADRGTTTGRAIVTCAVAHIEDVATDPEFTNAPLQNLGSHTSLSVPMLRDGNPIGAITVQRRQVELFSDKQIELLKIFADQAVIAIENVRLFNETREALEQQTATAEVLQVINSSPGDLAPVFDAILQKAHTLCEASAGALLIFEGEEYRIAAVHSDSLAQYWPPGERRPLPDRDENTPLARLMRGEGLIHLADARDDDGYRDVERYRKLVDAGAARALLVVPLKKDDALLGAITAFRQEVRPFTDRQIALIENFAAQAVIAMENARLITETREALEQQTATAEVLQVINSSPGDLAPVFEAMLERAVHLCEAAYGALWNYDGEHLHITAIHSVPPEFEKFLRRGPHLPSRLQERLLSGEPFAHIADLETHPVQNSLVRASIELGGIRTFLAVPLRKDDRGVGIFGVYRQEVRPFSDKQIALLKNFAAQAVIAMENARLINETREARDAAETALRNLQSAQASLVQSQKMAALGQLTAGIAHEIKNPLNFVNNFAGLSIELLDELKESAAPGIATLDEDTRAEIDETVEMLTSNLDKIAEHGKRADNIVKSMLEHSRGVSGERREVDLNALIDEALNLAYHGARAQDQSFNITLERNLQPGLAPIEVAPQEITRVFLNLFSNGFYAANRRAPQGGNGAFSPILAVTTREAVEAVEITVRDNGTGIPPEVRDRLFQPFFTTKPTGEGTGLGLSISYDVITQQHGSTITVDSEPGVYTEFTIRLPRRAAVGGAA